MAIDIASTFKRLAGIDNESQWSAQIIRLAEVQQKNSTAVAVVFGKREATPIERSAERSIDLARQRVREAWLASPERQRLLALKSVDTTRRQQLAALEKDVQEARAHLERLLGDASAHTDELLDAGRRVTTLEQQAERARQESTPASIVAAQQQAERAAQQLLDRLTTRHFGVVKQEVADRLDELRRSIQIPDGVLEELSVLLGARYLLDVHSPRSYTAGLLKE